MQKWHVLREVTWVWGGGLVRFTYSLPLLAFDVGFDVGFSLQLAIADYINRGFGGQGAVLNKIGLDEMILRARVYETAGLVLLKSNPK